MKKILYADLRTLALVRFCLGLLTFYDFFRKIPYIEPFYSDDGILSRSVLLAKFYNEWKPTLLLLHGSQGFALILLLIGMLASAFYTLGIRTRLSNFIMWVILISFQGRFAVSLNAGDILLTLLIFWSFWLPMNAVASWDAAHVKEPIDLKDFKFTSIFTVGWIAQIFFLYIFTFFYKWHPDWFKEGTTLYYALSLDSFTTGLGKWLLNFPGLMKFLSISTLWLEGIGPWLLLIPFKVHWWRLSMMLAFFGLHIGIGLTMIIGTFVPACLVLWLFLLPTEFWQWWERASRKLIPQKNYTLFYDKDCGFCRRMCFLFKEWLGLANVDIKSSEENSTLHKKIVKENSWAGMDPKGETFFRYDNFLKLLPYSRFFGLAWALKNLIPAKLGDKAYRLVAGNRPLFTKIMNKIGSSRVVLKPSKPATVFGLYVLLLSFAYNLDGITKGSVVDVKGAFKKSAYLLRLNQKWNMFAPYPSRSEGWIVVEGNLVNGKTWDPWRNKPVDFNRPYNMADEFESNVWRKVLSRFASKRNKDYRLYFGKYICRTWNNPRPRGGERLQGFRIFYMKDKTPRPGADRPAIKKIKIWGHDCFKKTDWPG